MTDKKQQLEDIVVDGWLEEYIKYVVAVRARLMPPDDEQTPEARAVRMMLNSMPTGEYIGTRARKWFRDEVRMAGE